MISEVFNEDCMIGMARYPDKLFDLAIVDPPYSDNVNGLKMGYNRDYKLDFFKRPTSEYITELFRVSRYQIIWGFNYFLDLLPPTPSIIFWYKHQNGHFSEGEAAWTNTGKTRFFDRPYQKDQYNKIHPTQKPIALYGWLLSNYAWAGYKILDTHMGSQSSRIAAYNMGFDYWGWEIDAEYFEAGNKRFKEQTQQLTLA